MTASLRCLKQDVSVTYYLIVFNIVFNTQFSIFNILFSNILHTFSNVSEPDWVCQIFWLMLTEGAIWFAFKVVFFYFKDFLSSKFLCGILSLSISCLIMEKSAMQFQNIFVGEPKYGWKMIFSAILNWKVVGS